MPPIPSDGGKIYSEYFSITKEYQTKYGKRTILLMQVGSFFEIYGLKYQSGDTTDDSEIVEISQICQFTISEKKAYYKQQQVLMSGFPDYRLEKYLQKITENNYTVVVFVQEKNEKNTTRVLHGVYSTGTFLSYETDTSPQITNNIMCIWMEIYKPIIRSEQITKTRDNIIFGISVTNIFTGKSSLFEYKTPYLLNPTTFDELERAISMYSPSEIILISPFDDKIVNMVLQYSGIKNAIIHRLDVRNVANDNIQNCLKQNYIKHLLSSVYGDETYQICSEFHTSTIATQAFCYLLNFIQEHNPNLMKRISLPVFHHTSDRMILANHTLKQLNITDDLSNDGKRTGQLSSVLSFLNKCCSPIGKRRFQQQLLHPTCNQEWLLKEYDMIDLLRTEPNYEMIISFRKLISQIKDMEKMCRQLILQKIYPSSIYQLYKGIITIQQINTCLFELPDITDYLCIDMNMNGKSAYDYIDDICRECIIFIEEYLVIESCKIVNSTQNFDENIICTGISVKLDEYIHKNSENRKLFQDIRNRLNELICTHENAHDIEYIREHVTEKSGISFQITKKRGTILKNILNNIAKSPEPNIRINDSITIQTKDIKITHASTSNDEIEYPLIHKLTNEMLSSREKINNEISRAYSDFIVKMEKDWFSKLEDLSLYVGKIDVLQSKVYSSKEYNYCKPEIDITTDESFVDARDLRHCLIEHIQQNEIYVPNDIMLGTQDTNGILLYGTNSVGKTSMIRALGISVILAQAGMYVPCSRFVFHPYRSIFSRILGNDNLFKGLSTFAVEMSELRIILKMADKYSLILGDEVCSGTETESALSIFVSALMELHGKSSSFMFATHFHEIIHYDEVKELYKMKTKHLSVYYDRELDALVYDRKLKNGSGTRMYGLEVCKSLYLPEEFLKVSYQLRNKYFPDTKGDLSYKSSHYNVRKIKGLCELCKAEIGDDVHHLQEQHQANDDGFIGHFNKNHAANLINVCKTCHLKEHAQHDEGNVNMTVKKTKKVKTTQGYVLI